MKKVLCKIGITIALVVGVSLGAKAQQVVWDAEFDFRFDNREYGNPSKMIAPSETIFGAKLIPQIGMEWSKGHTVITGAVLPSTFGDHNFMGNPEWLAYYRYNSARFKAYAGKFPRSKMDGSYSAAFFSDKALFEDKVLEGLLLQYTSGAFFGELGCDWNGHNTNTQREKVLIFSAGQVGGNILHAGYTLTLHHHAGSFTTRGVVDNGLGALWAELNFAKALGWKAAYVRGSLLKAYQNDRKHIGVPVLPQGFELDAGVQIGAIGVRTTMYKGGDLMPYYDSPHEDANGAPYADNLYHGDIFYHIGGDSIYGRAELFWEPRIVDGLNLRISSIHHWDGKHTGWQQVVSLATYFGNN